jgi:glycosyltransferase involved in cell wall biosynthesis
MPPPVAVVVCTRNRAARLPALLGRLAAQGTDGLEVVVVDDASDDDTPAVLAAHAAPWLRTVREPRRVGPSVARDDGWRATTAPLVAFTDDDCEPQDGWLDALRAAHAADPAAVLQGRTTPLERERHLLGPLARTQVVERLGPYYQCCNIAYPRDVLERVGGFDRTYDWGGEDTDLAWRAIAAGAEMRWVPDAHVQHAVTVATPVAFVRSAGKFSDAMRLVHDHAALRPLVLEHGLFWKRSHPLVLLALLGLALARRRPVFALLALPYLRDLRARAGGRPQLAPVLAAYDVAETATTIRGGIRHRTPVV